MKTTKRSVIERFLRGLAYAVGGSAVAYGLANVSIVSDLAPRYPFLVPVATAALLAADKWFRARREQDV